MPCNFSFKKIIQMCPYPLDLRFVSFNFIYVNVTLIVIHSSVRYHTVRKLIMSLKGWCKGGVFQIQCPFISICTMVLPSNTAIYLPPAFSIPLLLQQQDTLRTKELPFSLLFYSLSSTALLYTAGIKVDTRDNRELYVGSEIRPAE